MSRLEGMIAAKCLTGTLPETAGEVSAKFLEGARAAIDIYRSWGLKVDVDLSGFTPVEHKNGGDRVATFFTLGVDSFYTLLSNIDEIDDIVYVQGFEKRLHKDVLEQVLVKIKAVAKHFDKNAVIWPSDIRNYLDHHVHWLKFGHGPALASEGLLRESSYKKIYISASTHYPVENYATQARIDPLWSTETLEFNHFGAVSRIKKLKYISEKSQYAVDLLRVCYQGKNKYNCGVCAKCVRTIISLNLLGLQSSAFGPRPSLRRINELAQEVKRNNLTWMIWEHNIHEAEQLLKALKGQL
jgi:hypothetical protein